MTYRLHLVLRYDVRAKRNERRDSKGRLLKTVVIRGETITDVREEAERMLAALPDVHLESADFMNEEVWRSNGYDGASAVPWDWTYRLSL